MLSLSWLSNSFLLPCHCTSRVTPCPFCSFRERGTAEALSSLPCSPLLLSLAPPVTSCLGLSSLARNVGGSLLSAPDAGALLHESRAHLVPVRGSILSGLVLCSRSAGVGRTGCFIVIDAMLERMKHEKTVDIYGHVTCMRSQRNYMVQTEDQYIFIHEALLEAATCGNTEVPARNLFAHIQKLTQVPPGESVTAMELEFKVGDSAPAAPLPGALCVPTQPH